MQHVIIGAGPAGVVAAETLRKQDPHASIVIIGDEPEPPYSRMAIPYLLINKVEEPGTYLRKQDTHFSGQDIQVRQNRVSRLNADGRCVVLDNGESVSYDRLLIATGSSPATPPVPGMDLPGVSSCWTLADARKIIERAKPGSDVVLIGAGFVGCIVLEALALRGVNLTVVEMGDRMVPRMLNEKAGGLLKDWCIAKGVNVHVSASVQEIKTKWFSKSRMKVRLNSGEQIEADLVVSATGVRPNIGFLDGCNVEIDQGILVDQHMQTNLEGVYAAGDVAQGRDFSTGEHIVQAIQPTAVEHGRVAAMNMVGETARHDGCVNMNVLDTLGLISSSFGLWHGVDGGDVAELYDPENFRYVNLQFEEDRLVGASAVGLTQHVGVLRGLIQGRRPLGVWKERLMDDPSRVMEAYLSMNHSIVQ